MNKDPRVTSWDILNVLRRWQLKDLDIVDLGAHNFKPVLFIVPVVVAAAFEVNDQFLGPDHSILDLCLRKFANILTVLVFTRLRGSEIGGNFWKIEMVFIIKLILIRIVIVIGFVRLVEIRVHRSVAPIPRLVIEPNAEIEHCTNKICKYKG